MNTKPPPLLHICFRNRPIVPSMKYISEICSYFDTLHAGFCQQKHRPYTAITLENLRKPYRGHYHVLARGFITHYLHSYCDWTMQAMGWLFRRDHSSIVHGCQLFEENITGEWHNEYKESYPILEYGMHRPLFPNYDIEAFYKKNAVVKVNAGYCRCVRIGNAKDD